MPEVSCFFGIVVRMFAEAGGAHHRAHFHAYYQGDVEVIGIDPIEHIDGGLPQRQTRLVVAWAELHHDELRANWERLRHGRAPVPIDPLS